ncbi:MAG: resuscitation-promoting factor RpfB [Thermoleophilaceae bacterium]|nr:resuscitation-promoting factor RpfB [Thermoleophilaceae bacterium]
MSPHTDAVAHFRWRFRLRALAVALVATTTLSAGVALAATGGTTAKSNGKSAPTLRIGSKGQLVKQLQTRLRVRPASGYYGSRTARKVKFFQQDRGLRADGIAGPATLRALGLLASESRSGTSVPAVLKKIAQCESGGNPRAVSPDGRYRGKYQFDQSTWEAYGGSGDPAKAPESVQDRVAVKLYRARGTAPWPNCA